MVGAHHYCNVFFTDSRTKYIEVVSFTNWFADWTKVEEAQNPEENKNDSSGAKKLINLHTKVTFSEVEILF